MKRVLVSLAILGSLGLTACADMGDGYGYNRDYYGYDRGYGSDGGYGYSHDYDRRDRRDERYRDYDRDRDGDRGPY